PDESRCVFLWNQDSGRNQNLYLYSPDSEAAPQRLTSFAKQGITGFCWGRTGDEIFFLLGTMLFRLDLKDLSTHELYRSKLRMRSLTLSPDHSSLCFLKGGNLCVYDLEAGSSSQVTGFEGRSEGIGGYAWSPDSRRIAFLFQDSAGTRQVDVPQFGREAVRLRKVPRPFPGDPDNVRKIGVLEVPQGEVRWVDREFATLHSFLWSPSGNRLLVEESAEYASTRSIYICGAEDLKLHTAYREESPAFTFSWIWSSQWIDDDRIALTSDGSGFCHLYALDLRNSQTRQLTSGEWEVLETFPVRAGALYFIANRSRPEDRVLYRVELDSGDIQRAADRDGVYRPSISASGENVCVLFSDDMTPFDLYFIREGKLDRVTESPLPGFGKFTWAETQYLTIPGSGDGVEIRIRMMLPSDFDSGKKYPAIIGSVYSNAVLNQWGGRDAHPTWGLDQFLVQVEGYVLLNLDLRGSLGYGRKFREDMLQGYGVVDIQDIAAAARYLQSLPYIQGDRIGIWGSSYGGLLTLMSLFKNPGLFACGIAGAPATNVYHSFPGQMEVMKSSENKGAYENSSAYYWSQGLEDPAMIIHGIRDTVVLFMDSVSLVSKMIEEGKNFEFVVLPDAPHAWDMGPLHQTLFAFRKMIDFFGRHLKD
ncbi:MAG: prolyl oligopeptidase family serine peptidase, partial [Candidatus Aminicenantaceae bacterium]